MTIDFDCLRDVLKMVANSSGDTVINQESEISKKYGWDIVENNTIACDDAHLFLRMEQYISGAFSISGLSIVGFEKLSRIKNDTIWAKIKPLLISTGAKTVDMMFSIATEAATSML